MNTHSMTEVLRRHCDKETQIVLPIYSGVNIENDTPTFTGNKFRGIKTYFIASLPSMHGSVSVDDSTLDLNSIATIQFKRRTYIKKEFCAIYKVRDFKCKFKDFMGELEEKTLYKIMDCMRTRLDFIEESFYIRSYRAIYSGIMDEITYVHVLSYIHVLERNKKA